LTRSPQVTKKHKDSVFFVPHSAFVPPWQAAKNLLSNISPDCLLLKPMYKATVNKKSFAIDPLEDGFNVNDVMFSPDIKKLDEGYFHIIHENKSYTAEVVKADQQTKTFTIKINGRLYNVELKDRFDLLLEKMGMTAVASGKVNSIKAPMPGLVIDVKIKEGDVVKAGDPLLILEAMKMENIIKAPGEGVVKSVKAKKGESVEKNQVLIEF
jgi:biotin carboxyl carrier protein